MKVAFWHPGFEGELLSQDIQCDDQDEHYFTNGPVQSPAGIPALLFSSARHRQDTAAPEPNDRLTTSTSHQS